MPSQATIDASGTIVFFHAHPDDEAIFTGGTMVRLAAAGWRTMVIVATRGEHGSPDTPGASSEAVAQLRATETRKAARLLGAARLEFLGYRDSGMLGDPANTATGAFWNSDTDEAASRAGALLAEETVDALVIYDRTGIYGHPDHVKVHEVGLRMAELAGVERVYEVTVDREYLHFVETHLVVEAGLGMAARRGQAELGLAASTIGTPTVLITTTVDVRGVLEVKREAMAAHASQIPETASAMRLPTTAFSAVYGYEWFIRHGPTGPIETL